MTQLLRIPQSHYFSCSHNRIAACSEVGSIRVVGAALVAQNFAGIENGVGNHRDPQFLTSRTQVIAALQVAAH